MSYSTPRENSHYAEDWRRIAEKDLNRVERSLQGHDPELAGFCLQQAVEKFLKAYLIDRGWELRRIHDLEVLLDDAIKYDPSLDQFRGSCQKITKYYMLERYPLASTTQLTEEEVRESLERVSDFIQRIRENPIP